MEWDKWTNVVVYFRVGRNNKGSIRVWLGEQISEQAPQVKADGINFGFGDWIDDTHLNGEVTTTNEKPDYIGCKFGLYVSSGGDRIIRFDDIRALEGNPDGAFGIVCPPSGNTDGIVSPLMKKEEGTAIFSIDGKHLSNSGMAPKGLYIDNGKKYIK